VNRPIRIGTRGSRLALAQAEWFRRALETRCDVAAELVIIKTSGDRFVDRPLRDIGGKGLFVKEIEQALLEGGIDCAIHSMKDLPAELAGDLVLSAVPEREDPRDVLITRDGLELEELPAGFRVGTSSLRRRALCLALRPDLAIEDLRGNVDTRLRKLESGDLDAILLAAAGLNRLGISPSGARALDPMPFLPAIGQGALAIETRQDEIATIVGRLDDRTTHLCTRAERAVLAALGGSCHTPIAALGEIDDHTLTLDGVIASPDGSRVVRGRETGSVADPEAIGRRLAEDLCRKGGDAILAELDGR